MKTKTKEVTKVKILDTPKRYISDVIRSVFTTTRNKKTINVVDALLYIGDMLKEAKELLEQMNAGNVEEDDEDISVGKEFDVPVDDLKDRV